MFSSHNLPFRECVHTLWWQTSRFRLLRMTYRLKKNLHEKWRHQWDSRHFPRCPPDTGRFCLCFVFALKSKTSFVVISCLHWETKGIFCFLSIHIIKLVGACHVVRSVCTNSASTENSHWENVHKAIHRNASRTAPTSPWRASTSDRENWKTLSQEPSVWRSLVHEGRSRSKSVKKSNEQPNHKAHGNIGKLEVCLHLAHQCPHWPEQLSTRIICILWKNRKPKIDI